MNYRKAIMWFFVLITVISAYVLFNHSSIPLLFAYIIYPFLCSLGLIIAGLVGKRYIEGKIILTSSLGALAALLLIMIVMSLIMGVGIIYWTAIMYLPLYNVLFLIGIAVSGLVYRRRKQKASKLKT